MFSIENVDEQIFFYSFPHVAIIFKNLNPRISYWLVKTRSEMIPVHSMHGATADAVGKFV
jgi:hypothetical protein